MWRILTLIFCLMLADCAEVGTNKNGNNQKNVSNTATALPTVEKELLLKPVTPNVKLNTKQQKLLNNSLPSEVREILEKAERFEILAEPNRKSDSDEIHPTLIAKITDDNEKKTVLEAF